MTKSRLILRHAKKYGIPVVNIKLGKHNMKDLKGLLKGTYGVGNGLGKTYILDESDKSIRKGDVVVCHSNLERIYGELGEVIEIRGNGFFANVKGLLGSGASYVVKNDDLEVIDHIDDDEERDAIRGHEVMHAALKAKSHLIKSNEFQVGDRVEYVGEDCYNLKRGTKATVSLGNHPHHNRVRFDNGAEITLNNKDLKKIYDEPQFEMGDRVQYKESFIAKTVGIIQGIDQDKALIHWDDQTLGKVHISDLKHADEPHTVEPLNLPGEPQSYLLALDVSGSSEQDKILQFLSNHMPQLICKVTRTITFDTEVRHMYWHMPDIDAIEFGEGRGGTDIHCVLEHALTNGFKNILLFSDGYFAPPRSEKFLGFNIFIVKTPDGPAKPLMASFGDTLPKVEHVEQVCNPDQFPWPYNAKPSMLKCEEHSAAKYIDGYFVDLVTRAPEGVIEVVCHNCGHKIKEVKLDLHAEDPRLQQFEAYKPTLTAKDKVFNDLLVEYQAEITDAFASNYSNSELDDPAVKAAGDKLDKKFADWRRKYKEAS